METPTGKPEPIGILSPSLSEDQCHCVLAVALTYARSNGIRKEDSEDRARDFLLHLMLLLRNHLQIDLSVVLSPAWLARTADNWMKNCLRTQRRRHSRELEWPSDTPDDREETSAWEPISTEPSPDIKAIRAEFCQRVQRAIAKAHLTPAQYELIDSLLSGERPVDIAGRLDHPPESIRQRIRTLRVRIRKVFQECGLSDAEIQEYLSVLRLSHSLR